MDNEKYFGRYCDGLHFAGHGHSHHYVGLYRSGAGIGYALGISVLPLPVKAGYPPQNLFALLTRGMAALNWFQLSDSGCVRYVRNRNNKTNRGGSDAP